MGWRTRIASWLLGERKASQTTRLMALAAGGSPIWTPRDYAHLAAESYGHNVTVYACVTVIARAVASLSWAVYRRTPDGEQVLVDAPHPLAALVARPNPRTSFAALIETLVGHLLLAGNAYLEFVGPSPSRPVELWTLRPDRVRIVPSLTQTVAAYDYTVSGRTVRLPAEHVVHLRLFHPTDDWYGMSPIEAAARTIDADNEAVKWNKALLENSARPSGALVTTMPLSEEAFRALRADLDAHYRSATQAGRPLLLEGGLDWKEMGLSPKDMDWLDGRKFSKREIAQVFGVPPELIGDSETKTYSNYREARAAFYQETVLPLCHLIRDALHAYVAPLFGPDLTISYDPDNIAALQEEQAAKWARISAADFLTINEKRRALGYEPIAGGDVVLVNGGLVPLDSAAAAPAEAVPDLAPADQEVTT